MTVTRYVNTAADLGGDGQSNATTNGGDGHWAYKTLNAAEDAIPATLTESYIIECCGTTTDSTAVTFSGTTVGAYSITVRGNTGDAAGRHAGVYSTSKYRLNINSTSATTLTLAEAVTVQGIQIANTGTSTLLSDAIDCTSGASLLESVLIWSAGAGAIYAASSGTTTVRNCIIYGALYVVYVEGSCTATLQNCTLIGIAGGSYGVYTAGSASLTNCYVGNCGTEYDVGSNRTTCAHSSATVYSGSTASIAHTTANFTNVTASSQDYHLVSGASATLLTGGTDLSATFTTDIDAETRSDWGIGADEYVSAGVTGKPMYAYAQQ